MQNFHSLSRLNIYGDIVKYISLNPVDVLKKFYKKFSKLNYTSTLTTGYRNANYRKHVENNNNS